MKITLKALLITLAIFAAPLAWAQDNVYYPQVYTNGGQITASVTSTGACPPGSCIGITIPNTVTTITVGVLGTFSATLQPEESQNGGYTWTSAGAAITTTGTTVYTVTAFTNFRVRASAYVSGVANVNIQAGPTGGSGSAGAGVTSLNGLVGGVTLAAGSGITLTPSGNTITIASSGSGSTCGSTNGQLLYNASGTCAGTPSITTDGAGDLTVGGEVITGEVLANASVGSNLALTCSPAPCTVQYGTNGQSVTNAFTGSLASFTTSTGVTVGSPIGGAEGLGTINATGLFVNGVAVSTATSLSFSALTSGTNTTAAMIVGTGASLASVPQFNIGAVGTPGVLGLLGTTSGTATITAPAVAGTTSNAFLFSNALRLPNGSATAPSLGGSGITGESGIYFTGAAIGITDSGTSTILFDVNTSPEITLGSGGLVDWSSTTVASGTPDTGISRISAGVVGVGTGAQGSVAGTLQAAALNCGVLNTTACVITGFGSTSGSATITWPAVAGTTSNQIVFSNAIASSGSNTGGTPQFSGTGSANQTGYGTLSTGDWVISRQGSSVLGSNASTAVDLNGGISFATCGSSFGSCSAIVTSTVPTIAAAGCGGSGASISGGNSTASFDINVGTGPASTGCTVTMPAAKTGWSCSVNDRTTISTTVSMQKQTGAISTTSVVLQNFSDVTVATAPAASDIYHVTCTGY
jgi:hypothetical protein